MDMAGNKSKTASRVGAAAFALRASAIVFNIRMGPPGEFIRIGGKGASNTEHRGSIEQLSRVARPDERD